MREFTYKARNNQGELVTGTVEAETESSASTLLTAKKLYPVRIKEEKHEKFAIPFLNKVKVKDKVFFIRQLATMANAGLPISQSLSTLLEQTHSDQIKKMVEQMIRDVEAGDSLATTFSRFPDVFTKTDLSMIAAGEASGKIDEVLEYMASQAEKSYKTAKKIKTVFIYPSFLLCVVIGVVALMMIFVLPQMQTLYSSFGNAQLPLPTQILMGFSNIMAHYYYLVILMVVAIFFALRMYVKTDSGRYIWHSLKLRIPLLGNFLQMSYMAMFSRTMSSLISSGVPILEALKIVGDTMPNIHYENAIRETRGKVKQGGSLSQAIKENPIFPVMVSQMIGVGENTGEIDSMLSNLADYYNDEIDNWVKSFQSLLEPIMIVVMGLIVGSIILSIIMPIYNVGIFMQH